MHLTRSSVPSGSRQALSAVSTTAALACALLLGLSACAPAVESPPPAPGSTQPAQASDASAAEIPARLAFTVVLAQTGPAGNQTGRDAAVTAFQDYAESHGATVVVVTCDTGSLPDDVLQQAVLTESDLVVTFGSDLLSSLDRISSSNLDQQFLMIGGQLPEPTDNVTAVIWAGADARETLTVGANGEAASGAVFGTMAPDAIAIGVASVVAGRTGIVLSLTAQ